MALSDDFQEFAAVPPVLLNSAHSTTQHTGRLVLIMFTFT